MKLLPYLFLFISISLAAYAEAEVRTLEKFYTHLDQAASVLKSKADLDAQRSQLQANEAQKGWELFGSIAGGYQKSPFAREPFGRFFDPTARIGLRYPLLGSAEKQQRAISDAATQVAIEDIRLDWSKRLAALFMEENYAAYWSAQKMLALNEAYIHLRSEGVEKVLHERREAGLLLLSDYYEFMSAFEQAERARLEFDGNKAQALTRLSHLTNTVVVPFKAIKPSLNGITQDSISDIDQPDLGILHAQIENLQNVRETENWQGIESDFSAMVFGGPAIPHPSPDAAQYGYGGAVGVNIRMPLEIISFRKNEKSRLNSQLSSLHAEHLRRKQELSLEFDTLFNRYHQIEQQINFQRTRLEAARESLRERYLRLQALDGDVIEKYIQAINSYYRTAIEYVETESEQWKLHIRLRQFISMPHNTSELDHSGIEPEAMIAPLQQAEHFFVKKSVSYAVYVWDYDRLLAQSGFWESSRANGIKRILLSLNQRQIASSASNSTILNKFLREARERGVKVELLLGDPDWILPEARDNLLQIIRTLRHIQFDGLHLDIEPDQLEAKLEGKARLKAFLKTIRQATAISPWPVAISMHPRYLKERFSFDLCIPCQLKHDGVKEIAVMYYSMNLEQIIGALKSAMHQHPDLIFSLAQSLEPELPPENSYVHKPQSLFRQAMMTLHNRLQSPNFGGLVIQSWQDWETYNHENPL